MRKIRDSSEDEMIAVFLQTEVNSVRFRRDIEAYLQQVAAPWDNLVHRHCKECTLLTSLFSCSLYQVLECDTFVRKKLQDFGMDG